MEYFLPLSVMAMIISSISIFLIDNQNPTSNTDPENDPSPSNSSEKLEEDSVDEFTVSENEKSLPKDVVKKEISNNNTRKNIQSTNANLKAVQNTFSMLWNTTPKSNMST